MEPAFTPLSPTRKFVSLGMLSLMTQIYAKPHGNLTPQQQQWLTECRPHWSVGKAEYAQQGEQLCWPRVIGTWSILLGKTVPGNTRPSKTHQQNCTCKMPMALSAQSNASQLPKLIEHLLCGWLPMATIKKSTTTYAVRLRAGRSKFAPGIYHVTSLGRHCSQASYPN